MATAEKITAADYPVTTYGVTAEKNSTSFRLHLLQRMPRHCFKHQEDHGFQL